MSTTYGSRLANMWHGLDHNKVKQTWARVLAGLSPRAIERGLSNLPASWPPDAAQFRDLCKPAPPDYEALFMHAIEQKLLRREGKDHWRSPTVYWATVRLGYDMHTQTYQQLAGRWKAALEQAHADIRAGRIRNEVPPRDVVALPAPGRGVTDTETAKRKLAEALDQLRKGKPHDPA